MKLASRAKFVISPKHEIGQRLTWMPRSVPATIQEIIITVGGDGITVEYGCDTLFGMEAIPESDLN